LIQRRLPRQHARRDDVGHDRRIDLRLIDFLGITGRDDPQAQLRIRLRLAGDADELAHERRDLLVAGADVDFRAAGGYDPAVAVVHLGGASSDPSRLAPKDRDTMKWQARYLIQRCCYGLAAEIFIRTVDIISSSLRFLKLLFLRRNRSPEFAAQRDLLAMLLHWPAASEREALPAGKR
jgi:hypothetical protein